MKRIIMSCILVLVFSSMHAQVSPKLSSQPTKAKSISKKQFPIIKSRTEDMKLRARELSDSVTIMRNLLNGLVNQMDNMSEMGETESLRLQMAMDRLSKMMSTLSNILKKISDTAQGITQNIK